MQNKKFLKQTSRTLSMIWNFHPSSLSSMTGFREWLTPILGKKVNFREGYHLY